MLGTRCLKLTAPENWWLEDDNSFWGGLFSDAMLCYVSFREGLNIPKKKT